MGKSKLNILMISHKWKDDVKMDLKEIEWEGVVWIYLSQGRGGSL